MKQYPSILKLKSTFLGKYCIAFEKLDGSNFRALYCREKNTFTSFGLRTSLVDENTKYIKSTGEELNWGKLVTLFKSNYQNKLIELFNQKEFLQYNEITVFGEFLGKNSAFGQHNWEDIDHRIVFFDALCIKNNNTKLLLPQDFYKTFEGNVDIPKIVYEGKLTEEFIKSVRHGKFTVDEGVICKGVERSGAYFGGVWQCKIKTYDYLSKIEEKFGDEYTKYWE